MDKPAIEPAAVRLNRYLAQCGLGARRKCDDLIKSGRVFVNGRKVAELGVKVLPGDRVEYRGKHLSPVRRLDYFAYHKPASVMVTKNDPEGRVTVYQAIQQGGSDVSHCNYIGRLDFASEGLLLLTNDGGLIHALTHPRYRIKKVYRVQIERNLPAADREKLLSGIESEGQVLHAGDVRPAAVKPGNHWYEVDLYEGKNRQIRRMFEALGYRVMRLLRTQFASVRLGDLAPGGLRPLTAREIAALKSAGFPVK
jgi:23S rRNA pseudouridine2605 synthase